MDNKNLLAVFNLNNVSIVDRTYSRLLTGPDSLKKFTPAYMPSLPVYFQDGEAVTATADMVNLIGSDVVSAGTDKVYLMMFDPANKAYRSHGGVIDIMGFMLKESYSNFDTLAEHTVIVTAGTSNAPGNRFVPFDHKCMVTPNAGVNSVCEYVIFNVMPATYAPSPSNVVVGALNLPVFGEVTNGQEGLVMPYPLAVNGVGNADSFRWIAIVIKNGVNANVKVRVTPFAGHTLVSQVLDGLIK